MYKLGASNWARFIDKLGAFSIDKLGACYSQFGRVLNVQFGRVFANNIFRNEHCLTALKPCRFVIGRALLV